MGLIVRIKEIFGAKANALADEMEDPKASLDYSLRRLEENRRQVARSLVEVRAARQRLEDQQSELEATVGRYGEQAGAAVVAEREDLARLALQRKQEAELRQVELADNIANISRQEEELKQSQANLERKIAQFRSKKEELKAVHDSAQAQLRVHEALSGVSNDLADVGHTIRRAEERIAEMQSRADAIEGLIAEGALQDALTPDEDDIDRQLAEIGRDQQVEAELARLKAEAGSGEETQAGGAS